MEMTGTVSKAGSRFSEVTVYRGTACDGGCGHQCATCMASSPLTVRVDNNGWALHEGEQVLLQSATHSPLSLAAILYLLPLVVGVLGYLLVEQRGGGTGLSALGALVGLVLGFVPAWRVNHRLTDTQLPTHRVISVLEQGEQR